MKAPVWIGARIGGAMGLALLAAGCTTISDHRGYIVDPALVDSVHPGIDNKQSVEGTLGRPTFTSEYGDKIWYYVSSVVTSKPFRSAKIREHYVFAVGFDKNDNVIFARTSGMDKVAFIDPDSNKTPVLGKDRSFLQDLFGNIGQVGAGGMGGGGGGS